MRLGYLYSRYPVISQTFCDTEMLALERLGIALEIGSIYPPLTSLRHEHISRLRAPIHYAPPQTVLRICEKNAKTTGKWPHELVDRHERKYGPSVKAEQRARNALYFADLFARNGVDHFHVHFANRAAHTAIFLKEISGIPFSVTAHGQDFMKDLGNDDLLREICAAAEFVAAETDYSRELLCQRCPDSAAKIYRIYNGIDLEHFSPPASATMNRVARVIIEAMAAARPVVSTRLAGIPESVIHGETGLLVSSGDTSGLSQALEQLIRDPGLRARYGHAGRARIEQNFRIEQTVAPLLQLFEGISVGPGRLRNLDLQSVRPVELHCAEGENAPKAFEPENTDSMPMFRSGTIAYLIDRWPDEDLPFIERELQEMKRRNLSIVPFVCELNPARHFTRSMERMAAELEFLPDAMVMEAEWRAHPALAQKLEEERAQQEHRASSAIFLRQARFALVLRRMLLDRNVSHVHATSSLAIA